jgi:hypothetical protein
MRPIRTRDELLALVAANAPTKSCERAIQEPDTTTVHGGFTSPTGLSGWIVTVRAYRQQRWIIAIYVDEGARKYRVRRLKRVPWERWIGTSTGKRPLIDGDRPIEFAWERMKAQEKYARST